MNRTSLLKGLGIPFFLLVAFFSVAPSSFALNLAAVEARWTPPDSATPIRMWGFIPDPGSCPAAPVAWDVGPLQVGAVGANLTIRLRNCLSEPVSLVIPGQNATLNPQVIMDGQGRARVTSFTYNATPAGGTASYTWNNIKAGTFLYQSGNNPAKQVHMGLFGALKVGQYDEAPDDLLLIFSEIDPALHATAAPATPLSYKPKYFLINGKTASSGKPVPVANGARVTNNVLIRFANAGLMTHTPVLQGPYMKIIAEDGNRYPYAREQYSVLLPAGKTLDAIWHPTESGNYALYDRSLSLSSNGAPGGGMLVYLEVPFPWIMFVPAISGAGR
ncbi:MAG: multicopper oxidase domain-containing protein [Desulfobulbaceae bacterium]